MKQLKKYMWIGIVFVIIVGTLSHFFYEWSGRNTVIGLFTPVNESTWEHMKLLFFHMLLISIAINAKLKQSYPCITSSLAFGILLGTFLIPILFYTYTGILGFHLLFLDILTFIISVIAAFYAVYKLTLSCGAKPDTALLIITLFFILVCFLVFTYYPPELGLFSVPS